MTRRSSRKHSCKSEATYKTRDELWEGALTKAVGTVKDGDDGVVEMTGIESVDHTAYSRVVPTKKDSKEPAKVTVGTVIGVIVDEGWKSVVKHILEEGEHIEQDSYPPAKQLLKLGSVWMLNETEYVGNAHNAHAKRLCEKDESLVPNWKDMTLRVHFAPDRFHAAHEVDWSKYCRGLLLGGHSVQSSIAGRVPQVPFSGFPDEKDGAIVYEDTDLGFAIINKPGSMPGRATISNHAEDVVSIFTEVLKERKEKQQQQNPHNCKKVYVSLPQRVDNETHGLTILATKKEFASYMSKLLEAPPKQQQQQGGGGQQNKKKQQESPKSSGDASTGSSCGIENEKKEEEAGNTQKTQTSIPQEILGEVTKKYRCLVCVCDPNSMDAIENFHLNQSVITHFVDPKSPAPKRFLRHKPKNSNHEWLKCNMRITNIGDDRFRAACVSSQNGSPVDSTLAHRLWGHQYMTPAEDLGVTYVMQVEVELIGCGGNPKTHQLRGQLAALGFPIVGDQLYGGGICEFRSHRHGWNRMAVQCCDISFPLPSWAQRERSASIGSEADHSSSAHGAANEDSPAPAAQNRTKQVLVQSNENQICNFRLNEAWWTKYLQEYDDYVNSYTYYNGAETANGAKGGAVPNTPTPKDGINVVETTACAEKAEKAVETAPAVQTSA